MAALPPLQSNCSPYMNTLDFSQVINNQYDNTWAFGQSILMFLKSHVEYKTLYPNLYNTKLNEYIQAMNRLYSVYPQDYLFIDQMDAEVKQLSCNVIISVIKFKGRDRALNPRIVINIAGDETLGPYFLNCSQEKQTGPTIPRSYNYQRFHRYFADKSIDVYLEADNWVQSEDPLNEFNINFNEIHCEGFEDWFDFGRGVELLIKIEYSCNDDPTVGQQDVMNFYVHSLYYMFGQRLSEYQKDHHIYPKHHRFAHKLKVSYIRPRITPGSEQAFWETPNQLSDVMQKIKDLSIDSKISKVIPSIKYIDLQTTNDMTYEFDDNVCLCSEWCNLNAFFHFNPIYRFLIVRHKQLFVRNFTNIPDMYLFIINTHCYAAGVGLTPQQDLALTPLLLMMNSAWDYKMRYYNDLFMTNALTYQMYGQAFPYYTLLVGLSYNIMRHHLRIDDLCLQSDINPFSDIAMDNMINYYKILSELHDLISTIGTFVLLSKRKEWLDEFNEICREKYTMYFKKGYQKWIQSDHSIVDQLFTEDYEYSTHLPKSLAEAEIRSIRQNVLSFKTPMNPFNVRIHCTSFASIFILVHKYIHRLEPMLSTARSKRSTLDVLNVCRSLDQDLKTYLTIGHQLDYFFDDEVLRSNGIEVLKKEITVLYTLKLYFIGYGIQSYCLKSLNRYCKHSFYNIISMGTEYDFIYDHSMIEQVFQTTYPGETLFEDNTDFRQSFANFYHQYWGMADHELNPGTLVPQFVNSALFQYKKLYYWWDNNGNDRLKFQTIFHNLYNAFDDIIFESEVIFDNYLLPSIEVLSQRYEHYLEVMDCLVYYLVKANCFRIFSTIRYLIQDMHSIQVQSICTQRFSYSLSKPGWVQLFRTLDMACDILDILKAQYIVFDDEVDRISETLSETKDLVKGVYFNFYAKMVWEWWSEVDALCGLRSNPIYTALLFLHIPVGYSFLVAFIDRFRRRCQWMRKRYSALITRHPQQQTVAAMLPFLLDYSDNRNYIDQAMPLMVPEWQQHCHGMYTSLAQMDITLLGIDLNLADVI